MTRDFSDREREGVERARRVRDLITSYGIQPKGDAADNPRGLKTAHDYYKWMNRAPSTTMHSGAHLKMLEHEEHVLGINSYPKDHPRYKHVEEGRYYPGGEPMPGNFRPTEKTRASDELREAATSALSSQSRSNRLPAKCDTCGNTVAPGEGLIVRRSSSYVTVHKNES